MKKRIALVVMILVLAIILLFLPVPTRIDCVMNCVSPSDGAVASTGYRASIDGWYLDFLVLEDMLQAEITVKDHDGNPLYMYMETHNRPLFELSPEYHYVQTPAYDPQKNHHVPASVGIGKDFQTCCLCIDGTVYLGSIDAPDTAALKELYGLILE